MPVAVLSAELVQRLARWKGSADPVVSLFLNVDGRQRPRTEDYQAPFELLLKQCAAKGNAERASADLARIEQYVTTEFQRGKNRGIVVFSSGEDLWEVVELPVAVEDYLVVNQSPHVRQLETILDNHERIGVLLTDKQRARLLVVHFDKVISRQEIIDPLPRHDDDKGDWGKDHVKAHSNVIGRQHLRHAAQAMFELHKESPFERLVLCAAEETAPDVIRDLHAYLRAKLIGQCNLPVGSSDDDVIAAANEYSRKAERAQESQYVSRLRAGVAKNLAAGRSNGNSEEAVAGIEHTLKAVFEKRVDTLLVSEGYATEGWRCGGCNFIATMGRKCAMCGTDMVLVEDVVEEAVEDALAQKCRVEFCADNADLDVLGRIGALLRF